MEHVASHQAAPDKSLWYTQNATSQLSMESHTHFPKGKKRQML